MLTLRCMLECERDDASRLDEPVETGVHIAKPELDTDTTQVIGSVPVILHHDFAIEGREPQLLSLFS